jgi:hypothetical protein
MNCPCLGSIEFCSKNIDLLCSLELEVLRVLQTYFSKRGSEEIQLGVEHVSGSVCAGNDNEVILIELKTAKREPAATKPASTSAPTNSNKQ